MGKWMPHPRPEWVETINGLDLPPRGLVPLDKDSLMKAARDNTGLADFGEDTFLDPMERLLASIETESEQTLLGRLVTRHELISILEKRLRITDLFDRHPEIADIEVIAPIVITGMARTGSSILHELFAQDGGIHTPLGWEVTAPVPPPEESTYRCDPRIQSLSNYQQLWATIAPEFQSMHEFGCDIPVECIQLQALEFTSPYLSACLHAPSYMEWLREASWVPSYRYHKKFLQVLQWQMPSRRWVLKSPAALGKLSDLIAVYPDVVIVQTHRDPVKVLGSLTSLSGTMEWMRMNSVSDSSDFASKFLEGVPQLLVGIMQARNAGMFGRTTFVDVVFSEFISDPVGQMQHLYDQLGLSMSSETAHAMEAYLAARPSGRGGEHRYTLDASIDLQRVREQLRPYQEYYKIESEKLR